MALYEPKVKVHLPFDLLTFNDGQTISIDLSKFIYTNDDPTTLEKGPAYITGVHWDMDKEDYQIHYVYNEGGEEVPYEMNFSTFMRYCLEGTVALVAATKEETDGIESY